MLGYMVKRDLYRIFAVYLDKTSLFIFKNN